MGINFPNAPAVGELHPTPPQAGVPQYRWDGVAWVAQSQDQLAFVKRTGDTMSGALTLPADPAAALQAATKQYVDAKSSLYISDNPPSSPPDGSMWWDSDNGLLYIRYNDGAGPSQWVQAVATPAIDASVFVNKAGDTMGGALTLPGDPAAALQAAPKQYVDAVRAYAAPYDAIAYSGMQINGSIDVSQELGRNIISNPISSGGAQFCDGWASYNTCATARGTVYAANTANTAITFEGLYNHIVLNVTTPQASIAASEQLTIFQNIEGYRIARLSWGRPAAKPITVSFWTAHSKTGVYSVVIRNRTAVWSCAATYTQNVASTPEYKTVTFPGPTSGAWDIDNNTGLILSFTVAMGSTLTAPSAGVWYNTNYLAAPGQINAASSAGLLVITGVTVLPGTQAPTAAQSPTIMRPYDQELVTCQRYFFMEPSTAQLFSENASTGVGANAVGLMYKFPVTMRAAPTWTQPTYVLINANAPSSISIGLNSMSMQCVSTAAAGARILIQSSSSFKLDARL